ncbi:uncharacterized protein LOC120152745 [Hibiscus syriacus]|uniref:uncharacterized protein LOC120152745 n=1 Tax=Hibiscus syriacus TaxID=106335 RepID=UPI001920DF38|nr:uncharacterized protein LOC120152745 [Hibiscus syriacus]
MRLGRRFRQMLNKHGNNEVMVKEMVEKLMEYRVKADKSKLPGSCALDWEFNHSSIFVEADTPRGLCGARSTAALTIRAGGEVSFYDKYLEKGVRIERTINIISIKKLEILLLNLLICVCYKHLSYNDYINEYAYNINRTKPRTNCM